jgi:hypothetical protein
VGHPPPGDGCAEPAERALNLCCASGTNRSRRGSGDLVAGLTEGEEEVCAGTLQPEAAMNVWMDERGGDRRLSAGPSHSAGEGLRTRRPCTCPHSRRRRGDPRSIASMDIQLHHLIHPLDRQQLRPSAGMARLAAALAATTLAPLRWLEPSPVTGGWFRGVARAAADLIPQLGQFPGQGGGLTAEQFNFLTAGPAVQQGRCSRRVVTPSGRIRFLMRRANEKAIPAPKMGRGPGTIVSPARAGNNGEGRRAFVVCSNA